MKIEKQWENNRSKMISYIVFGAYLFLLTWLVLFKFAFTIEEIPHLRQLNLIPFHYETSVAYITHMKEVIYNILIFVPAGVYFTAFLGKRKWWLGIGASFFVSLTFETVQWIFSYRFNRKYTWQWGGSSALCISWKNISKEENEHDQWNRSSG